MQYELSPAAQRPTPSAAAAAPGLQGRRFLLVTIPFGPFGRRFAKALQRQGASVLRVLTNAGDRWDWGFYAAAPFKGPADQWSGWVRELMAREGITDVVVFGDSTFYSAGAVEAARAVGAETWVLENGYFRPHWVTLERGGVNASSPLPRDPGFYRGLELELPPPPQPIGLITPHHTINISLYFIAAAFGRMFYPRWRYPFTIPITKQGFGHTGRFIRHLFAGGAQAKAQEAVLSQADRFFLLCLQREGDSQLVRHSPFATNRDFMAAVLDSFAAHAPADCRLVVKNHPLDPGVVDLRHELGVLAAARGVADRVSFLDGGSLAALARASEGVISVNSTAALSAVGFRRPVKLLGEAFFALPGMVDQQPLDRFWSNPTPPDMDLFLRFRRYVSLTTQVNGNFHNPRRLEMTCANLAAAIARHLGRRPIDAEAA